MRSRCPVQERSNRFNAVNCAIQMRVWQRKYMMCRSEKRQMMLNPSLHTSSAFLLQHAICITNWIQNIYIYIYIYIYIWASYLIVFLLEEKNILKKIKGDVKNKPQEDTEKIWAQDRIRTHDPLRTRWRARVIFLAHGWRSHAMGFWRHSNGTRSLTHSLTHSILINLFIKVKLNTSLLPPLLSITFVPSAFYAYVWHILQGTSKGYIFFPTQKSSQPKMGFAWMEIF